jgi:hypothetical protein
MINFVEIEEQKMIHAIFQRRNEGRLKLSSLEIASANESASFFVCNLVDKNEHVSTA